MQQQKRWQSMQHLSLFERLAIILEMVVISAVVIKLAVIVDR